MSGIDRDARESCFLRILMPKEYHCRNVVRQQSCWNSNKPFFVHLNDILGFNLATN